MQYERRESDATLLSYNRSLGCSREGMRHRHGNRLAATLFAVAVIVTLALIATPELRALLLVTDSLGLDLLVLLFATQLRYFLYKSQRRSNYRYERSRVMSSAR